MKQRNNVRNTPTDGKPVFVVTRDKRRTSDWNFSNEADAKEESYYWIRICQQYDPKSKVSIVRTDKPRKIR
jgi:hypothetical protein